MYNKSRNRGIIQFKFKVDKEIFFKKMDAAIFQRSLEYFCITNASIRSSRAAIAEIIYPDKAKLSSWLSVVARSKAVDSYRRIARKREISMEEIVVENLGYAENSAADEEMYSMEEANSKDKLRSCIDELDEKEKELIMRRYYYEQKPAEIAVALDMPKKQVENRLYYVRQKLRKMMEKREGDQS